MNKKQIIRAWKDRKYRRLFDGVSHPAGRPELSSTELELIAGGMAQCSGTAITCLPDSTSPSVRHTDCSDCSGCTA
ncbi:mersacidin/lichenicidin family type 2 lantibiotic [Haliangium sp.]|uniref:mersacidin/lichenicidin family type 2 lantibiotic n=1 Tax=Haliangium sp. TaxID=2663208 RepID=UPI003D10D430